MNRVRRPERKGEMRAEYDIRGGVRGKYYERYRAGTNVVLLEQDVATVFRDSEAVNRALRLLIDVAHAGTSKHRRGLNRRSTRPQPPMGSGRAKRPTGRGA